MKTYYSVIVDLSKEVAYDHCMYFGNDYDNAKVIFEDSKKDYEEGLLLSFESDDEEVLDPLNNDEYDLLDEFNEVSVFLERFTPEEQQAIKKVYENISHDIDNAEEDYTSDWLTINTCRNGKKAVWYYDGDSQSAVYVDNLEELSDEEIENQLS